ncbi:FTR1 family protein [Candidatus Woesearchaeota archaeon]|nr:FTR1 family protein [Candidatus Woesearchaeota archaeon]
MLETFLQGFIMAFREGLEAFLIVVILIKFLEKTENNSLKKHVWHGTVSGIVASLVLGLILVGVSNIFGGADATAKLWESIASLIAMIFITTFIIWMIRHGSIIEKHVHEKALLSLSRWGIFFLTFFMVIREGAEIAIFQFVGKYEIISVISGIILSIIVVILVYHSIVKIKLKTILNITLIYLILQAGFLLGYSIHEGVSAAKSTEILNPNNLILSKAFDLSETPLNHKEGAIGVPLYVTIGWYSKPEWIQFLAQYTYTISLFGYWMLLRKKHHPSSISFKKSQ